MNVFLRELTANRKSTITWVFSMAGIVIFFMALYPAFTQDVEAVRKVLAQFPPAVRAALGLELETFFSVLGFYAYLLGFAVLAAAIQAMNIGTGVISKEFAGKTADFLLSKPLTRSTVVTAKLAAAFVMLLITNAAFIVASYIAVATSGDDFSVRTLMLMASTVLLVQLMFFALGALFSVIIPKIKSVVSVSLPTVFAFYIIGMISDLLENEEFRFMSPFRYYDLGYILKNDRFEAKFFVIEVIFVVAAIAASYLIYMRKDIHAAQ